MTPDTVVRARRRRRAATGVLAGAMLAAGAPSLAAAPVPGAGLVFGGTVAGRAVVQRLGSDGSVSTIAAARGADVLQPAVGGGLLVWAQRARPGRARIVLRAPGRPARAVTRPFALLLSPSVSGDGSLIAYRDATAGQVTLVARPGGATSIVTPAGAVNATPALSRDGRWLALARRMPGEPAFTLTLLRLTPSSEGLPPVARFDRALAEGAGSPSFSADGARIAFTRRGSVRVITLAGGPVRRLTPGLPNGFSARDSHPVFSPDGAYVYFARTSPRNAAGTILRVPATGGPLERITARGLWPAGVGLG